MENQKLFIIIGLLFTSFLLWQEWAVYNTPQDVVNINNNITTPQLSKAQKTINADVPTLNITKNIDTEQQTISNSPSILVYTDLFTLSISNKGGTINNLSLNKYPVSLQSKTPTVHLFNNEIGDIFQAQSGLLPADKLPTHNSIFTSEKSQYSLDGNKNIVVPLYWNKNGVEVIKNYIFKRDSYAIEVQYQITNNTKEAISYASYVQLLRDTVVEGNMFLPTFNGAAIYNDEEVYQKINFDEFSDNNKVQSVGGWIAMVQHYFVAAWIPGQSQKQIYSTKKAEQGGYLISALDVNPEVIAAGETQQVFSDSLFVGPKIQKDIEQIAGLDKTVDYGILYIIAKPLEIVLHTINNFVSSWGYAIILLTILIKIIFYKLSETSYRSMAKMRKLTPKMKKLKEIYGDDRQTISKKMMDLYKKEKVNPAAGCLPILVQIPVFIALYWVLLESVELRQVAFWWLPDLAGKDPYFILPVIMGISMFIQQKLNPPPPDPMQAKIMMALPLVFTIFFLWMPSGLVLYWVVNNLLSILQQWLINKRIA